MKLKYIGDFPLSSVQKSFIPNSDEIYEVGLEDGNYLLKTFPSIFEKIEDKKETPKVEIKEEVKVEATAETTAETTNKKPSKK